MAEIKPCPFCGSKAIKLYSSHDPSIHGFIHICEIGGDGMVKVESRLFSTEREAIEAWNNRTPTIEPERKRGKWIKEENRGQMYRCSACGNFLDFRGVNAGRGSANYCPNCGADMREGEQDE